MSTYKLYYFNGRGRAELSRLIFAAAGQQFEDIRYEGSQWPAHKSEMPLGQMPVLEVDGIKLPQSMSIARFLAKQFSLAGKDNLEQAKVDAVVDTSIDLATKLIPIHFQEDKEKKAAESKKFFSDELPKHLQNLEVLAKLYSHGGSFFVGNHLTWADLEIYDMLDFILRISNELQLDGNILQPYPWLQNNRQTVEKQANLAVYLKSRPPATF
jgi:glutathione S-transferase